MSISLFFKNERDKTHYPLKKIGRIIVIVQQLQREGEAST